MVSALKQNIQQQELKLHLQHEGTLALRLLIPQSTLSSWKLYLYKKCKADHSQAKQNASRRWNGRRLPLWVNSCIILTESITSMERRYSGPLKHNQQSKRGCKTESDMFTSVCQSCQRHAWCESSWMLNTVVTCSRSSCVRFQRLLVFQQKLKARLKAEIKKSLCRKWITCFFIRLSPIIKQNWKKFKEIFDHSKWKTSGGGKKQHPAKWI